MQTNQISRGREARQSKRPILQRDGNRLAHPGLPLPPQFPEAEPVEDKSVERVEKTRRNARARKPKSARGKSRFQCALICPFAGQNRRRRDGCEWSGQLSFADASLEISKSILAPITLAAFVAALSRLSGSAEFHRCRAFSQPSRSPAGAAGDNARASG